MDLTRRCRDHRDMKAAQYLWISYHGAGRVVLAVILVAAAAAVTYAAARMRQPVRLRRPGRAVTAGLLVTWVAAIAAFLAGATAYVHQVRADHLARGGPGDPVAPVTFLAAGVLFLIILGASRASPGVNLASAAIGAMAAPMIFEVPFDLIIMARTDPAVPPDPDLYRALYFAPLLLIGLTTLCLLTLSPLVVVSSPSLLGVALMLAVFAVWALAGFSYPSSPLPIALNVAGKVLAFATALSLFQPGWFGQGRPADWQVQPPSAMPSSGGPARPWTGVLSNAGADR
jgi:hypothetical protein